MRDAADFFRKRAVVFLVFLFFGAPLFGEITVTGPVCDPESEFKELSDIQKISVRCGMEKEAKALETQGKLDEAVLKYREAIRPVLVTDEVQKSTALWGILEIHQKQGKYRLALEEVQWFLKINPSKPNYWEKKYELEALIEGERLHSTAPVYEYIRSLRERYRDHLPPEGYTFIGTWVGRAILRLYDFLGDYDGGVDFVNLLLSAKNMDRRERKKYEALRRSLRRKGEILRSPNSLRMT
ncbi:MAG TPA: hypothetical protein PKL97_05225 [Candidatus Omnitrophota bacterium]|nr:hypothetical protein [Candidatus Omnitrophota bacterium]